MSWLRGIQTWIDSALYNLQSDIGDENLATLIDSFGVVIGLWASGQGHYLVVGGGVVLAVVSTMSLANRAYQEMKS